jgi:hypothetical protein
MVESLRRGSVFRSARRRAQQCASCATDLASLTVAKLGYSWGDTEAERAAHFPCDDLMADPQQSIFRAIDVDAPAPLVWRWLCQLRVAPYSYDWIDNWGRRSPRELTPGLDDLEAGQKAVAIFKVAHFERDRSITLSAQKSMFGDLALTYQVTPRTHDTSRIVVKLLVKYNGRVTRNVMGRVPPVGDLIMMRKQLRNLKKLAERDQERASVRDQVATQTKA